MFVIWQSTSPPGKSLVSTWRLSTVSFEVRPCAIVGAAMVSATCTPLARNATVTKTSCTALAPLVIVTSA